MNTSPFVVLTSTAALLSAAAGGMMYVFSTMVMSGLDRTGPVEALTAMRGINAQANASPAFLMPFFGAAILALVVGVLAALHLRLAPGLGQDDLVDQAIARPPGPAVRGGAVRHGPAVRGQCARLAGPVLRWMLAQYVNDRSLGDSLNRLFYCCASIECR